MKENKTKNKGTLDDNLLITLNITSIRDAIRKKKEKSFGHLSKRVGGCRNKTKKKIKFYFGQEHREGGGKNSLSKIKNMSRTW